MDTKVSSSPRAEAGRALVIEDNPDVRRIEVLILESVGWVVSTAEFGAEGLVMARRDQPDVVVCDLRLPDTHGIEVVAALAADPETASIPVVVLTASTDSEMVEQAMDAGALEFLTKPFRALDLLAHVRGALRLGTERRALVASEDRLRTSLDLLAEGIVLYRVEAGRVVPELLNRAAGRMFGLDLAQLVAAFDAGMPSLMAEDGSPLEPHEIPEVITASTGRPVEGAIVGVRGDQGSVTWVRMRTTPILNASGTLTKVLTTARDVTEAWVTNPSLEMAAAHFEAMAGQSPEVIIIAGLDRRVRYVNPAFARIFGPDPSVLLGRPAWELAHPDDREQLERIFADLEVRLGGVTELESRYVRPDGTLGHARLSLSNRLDDPAVVGFVISVRDITERLEAADRLAFEATHDALTGLASRSLILDRLDSALARSQRSGEPVVVLVVDLDGFQSVNDHFGRAAGDDLLVQAARRLDEVTRDADAVGRLAGDKFVIVAETIDAIGESLLIERIERALTSCYFLRDGSAELGLSIGISISDPGSTPDQLLASAYQSMFTVKVSHHEIAPPTV